MGNVSSPNSQEAGRGFQDPLASQRLTGRRWRRRRRQHRRRSATALEQTENAGHPRGRLTWVRQSRNGGISEEFQQHGRKTSAITVPATENAGDPRERVFWDRRASPRHCSGTEVAGATTDSPQTVRHQPLMLLQAPEISAPMQVIVSTTEGSGETRERFFWSRRSSSSQVSGQDYLSTTTTNTQPVREPFRLLRAPGGSNPRQDAVDGLISQVQGQGGPSANNLALSNSFSPLRVPLEGGGDEVLLRGGD